MKPVLILVTILHTLLLVGCSPFEDKTAEVTRLQIELANQYGARAAEIENGERQVSVYLGCKKFFNRCSPETFARGQKLVELGYAGTTSGWYWLGLLGESICIAIAAAAFFMTVRFLHLVAITPKKKAVDWAQDLIASAEARARTINLRTNELERKNGLMKRELSALFAAKQIQKKIPVPVEQTDERKPSITNTEPEQKPEPDY